MRVGVVLLALALAGCVTPRPDDVLVKCLPLKAYAPEWQGGLANELLALKIRGDAPHIADAIVDYESMRDADRACLSATRTQ